MKAADGQGAFAGSVVRFHHLDMVRGLAALLVCAGHLRAYVFQNFSEIAPLQPGLLTKAFYFSTGLGHQAVIVFFALSGFLVGGKALRDLTGASFCWHRYLTRRLVRLWLVIVPALLLTLAFDRVGIALTGGTGYDGRYYDIFCSGPKADTLGSSGVILTVSAFLGNLAFLQTLYVPIFGSNGPMWSLANEFWYYIVFPLLACVVTGSRTVVARSMALLVALGLIAVLPSSLWEGGFIWAAGAAAAWCAAQPRLAPALQLPALRVVVVALMLATLALAKVAWNGISDLHLGLAVAAALPVLALMPSPGGRYTVAARSTSEISYTLYLTHFPLLTLIVLTTFAPARLSPGVVSAALFGSLLALVIAWATLIWWCFERNTDRVHSAFAGMLGGAGHALGYLSPSRRKQQRSR